MFCSQVGQMTSSWDGPEWAKKTSRNEVLYSGNVPTPRESIFELFPTSQLPHGGKIQRAFLQMSPYYFYISGWGHAGIIRLVMDLVRLVMDLGYGSGY